jgi:UDP-glucose 4-epimerase
MTEGLTHTSTPPKTPRRVVVVGCRGFVGGAIVAELKAHKIPHLGISAAEIDLLAPDAAKVLAAKLQPDDALVIVSALTPDRGKDIATFMKNQRMMETVCAALAEKPVAHVVNIGSDAVYPDDASLIDESTPTAPGGFHGMMHLARELMLRSTVKCPLALLRPSLLYGAADTHNGYGPNRFRRTAAKEGKITLFGAGEEKRDHVHIDDVARIVRLVLQHRSQGALNIATGHAASFHEAADLVAAQFPDKKVEIVELPRSGPVNIIHRHFAVGALQRSLPDFRPVSLKDGIAAAHKEIANG